MTALLGLWFAVIAALCVGCVTDIYFMEASETERERRFIVWTHGVWFRMVLVPSTVMSFLIVWLP